MRRRRPLKAFVHSRRGLAISKVRADFARDRAHDPVPYGIESSDPAVRISYADGDWRENKLSVESGWKVSFDLPFVLRNLWRLRRADVIWTVIEWEWLAASFLQRIGLVQPKPIIGNTVFLTYDYPRLGPRRKRFWRWLMTEHVYLTAHSHRTIAACQALLPGKQFHFFPFGVSTRAFPVTAPADAPIADRPIRIYSIGDDPRRDWALILRAFGNDPRFEIIIVNRRLDPDQYADYRNLTLPKDVTVTQQREFYRWADFVVVAMDENEYSGITVVCEAAAMGKPVIASRTGGADSYFDDGELFYVPVGDAEAMRRVALETTGPERLARARAAQARLLREDYTAAGMTARYVALSRQLLRRDPA